MKVNGNNLTSEGVGVGVMEIPEIEPARVDHRSATKFLSHVLLFRANFDPEAVGRHLTTEQDQQLNLGLRGAFNEAQDSFGFDVTLRVATWGS
jgi:hypothetical protein